MESNIFWCDLPDILAKKEALVVTMVVKHWQGVAIFFNIKLNMFGTL